MCVPCLLGRSTFSRSPQPSGVIRMKSYTCTWNMQPTSHSLITKQTQKGPLSQHCAAPRRPAVDAPLELPKRRRGSGTTTRTIELFRQRDPLVFTPTHRLVKEMQARGVQAQAYHCSFHLSGQTGWTPERMGQKFIPRMIIWDEVCRVPRPTLETSRLARGWRRPGHLLWRPGTSTPYRRRNAPRLAPRGCTATCQLL